MEAETQRLHVVFFPLMAAGHMIPILDMAKLFASHNVKSTIITTPYNEPIFTKPLQHYNTKNEPRIEVEIILFPAKEVGLPEGIETLDQCKSNEMILKFMKAKESLDASLEQVLEKHKPNCLVADMFFPFATNVAAKHNIPRLVFQGTSYFALCMSYAMSKYEPQKWVSSNDEEFVVPHLPHEIRLQRSQLLESCTKHEGSEEMTKELSKVIGRAIEAESKSYGVIVNSFHDLEPVYADYYNNAIGRRAWDIGPVSLCNRENGSKFRRGKESSIDEHECLKWLDSKKPNSVVYICFGSVAEVCSSQLREITVGLEACEQDFIWVVKSDDDEEWLPEDFEERIKGKGLIIRGWAPQLLILDHDAVGAFVTHCGWNSTLEAISCGVPMVTWPAFAEQFYNEKLVTEVLKIGVSIGAKQWSKIVEFNVKWENIKEAIEKVMVGEDALEMKSRAYKIKGMARKAVEVRGSSYCNMDSLLYELRSFNSVA